jgi:hypothetical protein
VSAPSLPAIVDEAERALRDAPSLQGLPHKPDDEALRAARVWHEAVDEVADSLRNLDSLIERFAQYTPPQGDDPIATAWLTKVRATRVRVFDVMRQLNPDQAWFWTEDWQRKEREADADIAAGRTSGPHSTEEFLALLDASDAHADA